MTQMPSIHPFSGPQGSRRPPLAIVVGETGCPPDSPLQSQLSQFESHEHKYRICSFILSAPSLLQTPPGLSFVTGTLELWVLASSSWFWLLASPTGGRNPGSRRTPRRPAAVSTPHSVWGTWWTYVYCIHRNNVLFTFSHFIFYLLHFVFLLHEVKKFKKLPIFPELITVVCLKEDATQN